MSRVGDDLRRELRERVAALSAAERIEMAWALAESDLDLYCAARGVSREEGRRILSRARHVGRRPSHAAREVEG